MIQEQIKTLENIIDKEIDGYKDIEKLYMDKKEILIHGKSEELMNVDEKIMNAYKGLNNSLEARRVVMKSMEMPTFSMTDLINKIKSAEEEAAKNFESKKAEANKLAQRIFELDRVNLELIKHGMHVTNKTLEIIIRGLKPITNEYNHKGQNITKEQLEMSSIIEEA